MIQVIIKPLSIEKKETMPIYLALILFFILFLCGGGFAEMNRPSFINETHPKNGGIDYAQKALYVKGIAPSKSGKIGSSVEKNLQIRGTKIDAYRKAIELIYDVWIDAETKIENFMLESDIVKVNVQGMVRGLQGIGDPLFQDDGTLEQWYVFPLQGDFTRLFYGQRTDTSTMESNDDHQDKKIFSGLIIDCRAIGINPAIFPKIIDENGTIVYSKENANYDAVLEHGLVGYHSNIDMAVEDTRVAGHPMNIVGIKAAGKGKTDIVITTLDAHKLKSVDADHSIFKNCKVIIVKNE